jgi:hypothetical protein
MRDREEVSERRQLTMMTSSSWLAGLGKEMQTKMQPQMSPSQARMSLRKAMGLHG